MESSFYCMILSKIVNVVYIALSILGLHVTSQKKNTKPKSLLSFYLDQLQEVLKIYLFACFHLVTLVTVLRFENTAV